MHNDAATDAERKIAEALFGLTPPDKATGHTCRMARLAAVRCVREFAREIEPQAEPTAFGLARRFGGMSTGR